MHSSTLISVSRKSVASSMRGEISYNRYLADTPPPRKWCQFVGLVWSLLLAGWAQSGGNSQMNLGSPCHGTHAQPPFWFLWPFWMWAIEHPLGWPGKSWLIATAHLVHLCTEGFLCHRYLSHGAFTSCDYSERCKHIPH